MTISGISSGNAWYQTTSQDSATQQKSNFNQLAKSLQSGDLAGAQQAWAAIQQSAPTGSSASGQGNSPMDALGQALQSGDLSGAQQALAKLQHGHRHGHHHGGGGTAQAAMPAAQGGAIINTTA